MKNPTFATQWNAELIDQYYEAWLSDPASVDSHWQAFFEGFELGESKETPHISSDGGLNWLEKAKKQTLVDSLIYAYRSLGHTLAKIDPLGQLNLEQPRLELSNFDLSEEDLEDTFQTGHLLQQQSMKLRDII